MDRRRDLAHGAVADQDAIDRAQVGDLGRRAGKEGFVADVEHLAWQRLFDDRNAKVLGDRDDGVARNAV